MSLVRISPDDAAEAFRMIVVHAVTNKRAAKSTDYVALCRRYRDERPFRDTVDAMAAAVGSRVASCDDVDGMILVSEHGSPMTTEWKFLLRSLDTSKTSSEAPAKRSYMMASMLAVAATFFPTPNSQYSEDMTDATATVDDCIETLRRIALGYGEGMGPDAPDEAVVFGRILAEVQPRLVGRDDRKLQSIEKQVKKVLDTLHEEHLVRVSEGSSERRLYHASRRYRIQVASATNRTALDIAQTLRQRGEALSRGEAA